jgi:nucleoside diphosphate kinase
MTTSVEEYLSSSKKKRVLYGVDEAFLNAWDDLTSFHGDAEMFVTTHSYILFKPEAIVGRNIEKALEFLVARGFIPVAFVPLRMNSQTVQQLWRYQLNQATPERIRIVNTLVSAADSLFVLLRDKQDGSELGSVRLRQLKGPSACAKRNPEQLRYQLGRQSDFLNFVHTPNEPADFVREFGVFFSGAQRLELLRTASANQSQLQALLESTAQLYSRFPSHDISFAGALDRLKENCFQLIESGDPRSDVCEAIVNCCNQLGVESDGKHELLFRLIDQADLKIDTWDWITISAQKAGPNLPGVKPVLD